MASFAAAIASPPSLLRFPNPNPNPNRHPSLLHFPRLPPPKPLSAVRQRCRSSFTTSAVSIPFFIPSRPSDAVISVITSVSAAVAATVALPERIAVVRDFLAVASPERIAAVRDFLAAAAAPNRPVGECLKAPIRAVALGAGSWISLYAEILSVRCILTWFPNIPWDRQPFSALRDLCDPYLFLFRRIIPPINRFDVSPILAFWVLGIISSLLKGNPGIQ